MTSEEMFERNVNYPDGSCKMMGVKYTPEQAAIVHKVIRTALVAGLIIGFVAGIVIF